MNRDEALMIAKKTAEAAGYKVTYLGRPVDDRADERRARLVRPPQRNNPPTVADNLERLAVAARAAEKAGYTVRKLNQPSDAKHEDDKKFSPFLAGATRFMKSEK